MISLKSKREIELIRTASDILKAVFSELKSCIKPGLRTIELDEIAERSIRKQKAIPAFKNYNGFPASICVSINEEVVHGIPSQRKLANSDIVSIDVGVRYEGYSSDAARTWPVGKVSKEALNLIDVTRESFFEGINAIRHGSKLGDLSFAIQHYVESHGFSVVRDYVGHGIGRHIHEEPQIPNFGKKGTGPLLEEGMTLAIEPMVNMGSWKVKTLDNQWTVVTRDGELSAHYENTILITKDRVEVLT